MIWLESIALFIGVALLTFVMIQDPPFWITVLLLWLAVSAWFTAVLMRRGRLKEAAAAVKPYGTAFRENELEAKKNFVKTQAHMLRQQSREYGVPFGKRKLYEFAKSGGPSVALTSRQLERVNVQRRLTGKRTLNRDGFAYAIASAPPHTSPTDSNAWLLYFLMFNSSACPSKGLSVHDKVDGDVSIAPVGGGYGGVWTGYEVEPGTVITPEPAAAAALAAGAALATGATFGTYDSAPEPTPAPSYSAPDPSPSYSAPEPSYSDTSSSYSSPSFDSSPSPSFGGGE
jgi:hypothetical protein